MILKTVVDYLENELFGEIDYDVITRAVHYGKDSVARIFAASTGFTLGEYVRVRRLSEAGKRLAGGTVSVTDMAYDCGYSSPESFTKAFGKFHGFSPTECRVSGKYRYIPAWSCVPGKRRLDYEIKRFDGMVLLVSAGVSRVKSTIGAIVTRRFVSPRDGSRTRCGFYAARTTSTGGKSCATLMPRGMTIVLRLFRNLPGLTSPQ